MFLNVVLPFAAVIVFGAGFPLLVLWLADGGLGRLKARLRKRRNRRRSPKVEVYDGFTVVSYRGAPSVTLNHRIVAVPAEPVPWSSAVRVKRAQDRREQKLNQREGYLDVRHDELALRERKLNARDREQDNRATRLGDWDRELDYEAKGLDREAKLLASKESALNSKADEQDRRERKLNERSRSLGKRLQTARDRDTHDFESWIRAQQRQGYYEAMRRLYGDGGR